MQLHPKCPMLNPNLTQIQGSAELVFPTGLSSSAVAGTWVWGTRNKQTLGFFWQPPSFISLAFIRLQQKPMTGSWPRGPWLL